MEYSLDVASLNCSTCEWDIFFRTGHTTRWFPFLTGVTREELDEALHDMLGCEVAFGSNPEDDSSDSDVIIGVVPRDDGSIEIGAY